MLEHMTTECKHAAHYSRLSEDHDAIDGAKQEQNKKMYAV